MFTCLACPVRARWKNDEQRSCSKPDFLSNSEIILSQKRNLPIASKIDFCEKHMFSYLDFGDLDILDALWIKIKSSFEDDEKR